MNKKSHHILLFLRGILWLSGIIAIFIIRYYPSIGAIDTAGHIASNVLFMQDGMHNFTHNWFGGFIQNLLYPPAENILNSILSHIFQTPPLQTFQIYLTIVTILYIYALDSLQSIFSHMRTKMLYIVFCIFFLFLNKGNLTYFQGLGFVDLLYTGLTAQFLGGIGLFLLIKELFYKNRLLAIVGFTFLAVISHIITGPIAMLCLLGMWYHSKKKLYLYSFLYTLGLSAFFWLPFLFSMHRGTSSLITNIIPAFLFGSVLLLYDRVHPNKNIIYKTLSLTTIIILIPTVVNMVIPSFFIFPAFHYYRFASIALFFWSLIVLGHTDSIPLQTQQQKKQWGLYICIAVFFLGVHFKMTGRDNITNLLPQEVTKTATSWQLPRDIANGSGNNILIIDDERSIDFHIDSMLTSYNPQAAFVKGLYWESHYNNSLLSSYLATLLSERNIVVDYVFLSPLQCSGYNQVMNNFITQYGIKSILIRPLEDIIYLDVNRKTCLANFLMKGSNSYIPERTGEIFLNMEKFAIYKITTSGNKSTQLGNGTGREYNHTFDVVQTLPPTINFVYNNHQKNKYWSNGSLVNGMATSGVIINGERDVNVITSSYNIYAEEKYRNDIEKIQNIITQQPNIEYYTGHIDFEKIKTNLYKITTHTTTPSLLQIKLSYFPGWELYSETGEKLALAPIDGGMIGYSNSNVIYLQYTKPWYIYISYIITILVGFFFLYTLHKNKKG